jgi:hypothetical protein
MKVQWQVRRCRVAWRSNEAIGLMFLGKESLQIEAPVEI